MKEQSSVEWFSEQTWKLRVKLEKKEITIGEYIVTYVDFLEKAKEMHKEEHRDTWDNSIIENKDDNYIGKQKTFEQYYNETFKGGNK